MAESDDQLAKGLVGKVANMIVFGNNGGSHHLGVHFGNNGGRDFDGPYREQLIQNGSSADHRFCQARFGR